MALIDTLREAREYLSNPRRWTQGAMYLNRWGYACSSDKAKCACIVGALNLATKGRATDAKRSRFADARDELERYVPNLVAFNDDPTTTHADVLALLDKAIAHVPHS